MQMLPDTTSLGRLIREERKAQGLRQEQPAGLTGAGVRFVRVLEAGKESCEICGAPQVATARGGSMRRFGARRSIA